MNYKPTRLKRQVLDTISHVFRLVHFCDQLTATLLSEGVVAPGNPSQPRPRLLRAWPGWTFQRRIRPGVRRSRRAPRESAPVRGNRVESESLGAPPIRHIIKRELNHF